MLTAPQHLPLALAVLVGGTLFPPGTQEAPPAATAVASCRPAHIEPPPPPRAETERRLATYLARRYLVALADTQRVVRAAYQAAQEVGLDPLLLLAVAAVESSFNPRAESDMGAKGLMQIIPKYHPEKLRLAGGDAALFDPEASMRLGALILEEYVRRTGSLRDGLQFYNGAYFDTSAQYTRKVMAERARLEAVVRGFDAVRQAALPAAAA